MEGDDPGFRPWQALDVADDMRGPRPDEPGCYAPADLLAAYGYRRATVMPREARHA